MALNQNQFAMQTLAGTKVYGTNVQTVEFYSASPTATITPGEMVVLASTTAPLVTKVAKGTALTDPFYGVVLTHPLKDSFAVGDKMEIACYGVVVMMTASASMTGGDYAQYDYSTGKIATRTGNNTIVGQVLENASGNNALVRMSVSLISIAGAGGTTGTTGATGATGATGPTGV